jgi:GT2 family glycosyltransferase/glycosyltransferase involved in cell wall biosynthesis
MRQKYENELKHLELNPKKIYLTKILKKGYDPNSYFDSDWYLMVHSFPKKLMHDPLWDYVVAGESLGKNPNPIFSVSDYLKFNGDLENKKINYLLHYIEHGKKEGRFSNRIDFSISCKPKSSHQIARLKRIFKDRPLIAILIPVFNNWLYTERCLNSIFNTIDSEFIKVFIVNDSSTDETESRLKRFKNVNIINTPNNLGFTRACNFAFKKLSDFDYVYLMNNDTEAFDGFIANALEIFKTKSNVGIVGSRLIFPDGRLQESGGIIWSDGSGVNYGRNQDMDDPRFNFTREVDYVSGAGILINYKSLAEVNFFDEIYSPAYYEDTDLSFKLRAINRKTYVSSGSVLIHHEGKTHGIDINNGIKSNQVTNRAKFHSKWKNILEAEHFSPITSELNQVVFKYLEKQGFILWIDSRAPRELEDSGSVRAKNIMTIAQEAGYAIVFVPDNGFVDDTYSDSLRNFGIAICQDASDATFHFGKNVQFIWISRYPNLLRSYSFIYKEISSAQIIFDTVDLHWIREKRESQYKITPDSHSNLTETKNLEIAAAHLANFVITVSRQEMEILSQHISPKKISVVGNIHHVSDSISIFDETLGLIFVGSFGFSPNLFAINWFLKEIFPILPDEIQKDGITIIGSDTPQEIANLNSKQIRVLGWVEDTSEFIQKSRISIAPLLFGAGVKGKVGEAMSLGTPTVLTTIAAEGMNISHEREALIADSALDFANAINRLYLDRLLWEKLQVNAKNLISQKFSAQMAKQAFENILKDNTSDSNLL